MMRILVVGDGPRDGATVPVLVGNSLGVTVQPVCREWATLHGAGKGYAKKLLFAKLQAENNNAKGLIVTVDTDKDGSREKLKRLREAREQHRQSAPPFPTVIGEADPHGESWLLDDAVAVRRALRLPGDTHVPTVRKVVSPKEEIETLRRQSERAEDQILDVLEDIARLVDNERCAHAKETGFHAFLKEVREELAPHVSGCGDGCRCGDCS